MYMYLKPFDLNGRIFCSFMEKSNPHMHEREREGEREREREGERERERLDMT